MFFYFLFWCYCHLKAVNKIWPENDKFPITSRKSDEDIKILVFRSCYAFLSVVRGGQVLDVDQSCWIHWQHQQIDFIKTEWDQEQDNKKAQRQRLWKYCLQTYQHCLNWLPLAHWKKKQLICLLLTKNNFNFTDNWITELGFSLTSWDQFCFYFCSSQELNSFLQLNITNAWPVS